MSNTPSAAPTPITAFAPVDSPILSVGVVDGALGVPEEEPVAVLAAVVDLLVDVVEEFDAEEVALGFWLDCSPFITLTPSPALQHCRFKLPEQ